MKAAPRHLPIAFSLLLVASSPASAHVGAGATSSFAAGFWHPLGGLDHLTVMVAVGLWAALKGGRAIWAWPAAFVALMLAGGALGMAHVPLPFVEPAILASVVALGLLVALAVDLPVGLGAVILGLFATFHGHAHGTEVPDAAVGLQYMLGFGIATAGLHLAGILIGLGFRHIRFPAAIRAAGALCTLIGVGMLAGAV